MPAAGAEQMKQAHFRFYGELNDLLPLPKRREGFVHTFKTTASVEDAIEALGVPHTEVDLILVNGESAGFSYLVRDGDRISVYPVFRSLDVSPLTRVRPRFEGEIRFVLDTHLGRLAAYLRMFECWASTACIAMTIGMRRWRRFLQISNELC